AHYRANAADGAGLPLGRQPNGSTLVAVRATPESWRAWLAAEGTERRELVDDNGRVTGESVTYRHAGRHTLVTWSAPPLRARSVTAYGAALISEATRAVASPRQQPVPSSGVGRGPGSSPRCGPPRACQTAPRTGRWPGRRSPGPATGP
ncbi:MAG: hypothetical protein M3P96_07945, partial [Actinomycetota bacterium]|nr:hypothetical protein [Actinomycetota bacterium]